MNGGVQPACQFCTFGLIVTGEGEREFVPAFFRSFMERAGCTFKVIRQIGQRDPVTSAAKVLRMVGTGNVIPTIDEVQIGLPARQFLRNQPCHFLILLDDVEAARLPVIADVFTRYRVALDTMLAPAERARASVHFFANMIETYYFADASAVNGALGVPVLVCDHPGDVESISHPKGELKALFRGFDEKQHGQLIAESLDLDHVLSRPQTCAFLRSLFEWCARQLSSHCPVYDTSLLDRYEIPTGVSSAVTDHQ